MHREATGSSRHALVDPLIEFRRALIPLARAPWRARWLAPLVLLLLLAAQQVLSLGLQSEWGANLQDALHLPWFATLTALLLVWSRRWRLAGRKRWLVIIGGMLLGATGSEFVQLFTGRDAQWPDVGRDLLGGAATLLAYCAVQTSGWRRWLAAVAACAAIAAGLAAIARSTTMMLARPFVAPVLFDPDGYLARSFASPRSAATIPAPAGRLRLRFTASDWAGFELREPFPDWRGYRLLCLRLDVVDAQPLTLMLRIHDAAHVDSGNAYDDRFNRTVVLAPGPQTVAIELNDVAHAPRHRLLNLAGVAGLAMFQSPPSTAGRLLDVGAIWLTAAPGCER